ncbi:MAG: ATP-binding protein [Candidatus Eisenbacteria sp.]|nr:ATP-binding protein [Candidatus Eisenbacteria bacterium]
MIQSSDRTLYHFLVFILLAIVAVATSNVWLYREFAARLDHSLGEHLQSTAEAASRLIDAEILLDTAGDSTTINLDYVDLLLADRLQEFAESFGIDEILLLDDSFRLVYDSGETYLVGDPYPYLEPDTEAIRLAIEEGRSYSPTTKVGRAYLKRGFAPVLNPSGGWTALLVLEADVDFFELLGTWKRTLTSMTIGIAVILALLALLFLRLWSSGDRARRLLIRQDKLATLGRMVSQVAHEIRNPLGIIRISAQRLRRATHDPRHEEMIDYILTEADRLDHTVERYLDYAKGQPVRREGVSTRKFLREVVAEFQRSEPGEIELRTRAAGPDTVWVDRARFKQLLYNLIQNSVKAGARRVTIGADPDFSSRRPAVRWTVEDDGAGIAPRQRKRVFEPFYTTRPDGSGLGLSIVQQIAEEHGGTVSIQSRDRGGTVVTVVIPAGDAEKT